jgi:thioredoxin-like negative regulator of GroEL
MNNGIYKLVYCSRNCINTTPEQTVAEIQQILNCARTNNAKVGVTGALLFSSDIFAQVLEGPSKAVEGIFEKIQRDPRHSDVIVLQSEHTEARDFPEWSMAFAGRPTEHSAALTAALGSGSSSHSSAAAEEVLSLLRNVVVQEDDWA